MSRAFCEKEKETDLFSAGRIALAFGIRNDGGDEDRCSEKARKTEGNATFFSAGRIALAFGILNDGGDEDLHRGKARKTEGNAVYFQRSGSRLRSEYGTTAATKICAAK